MGFDIFGCDDDVERIKNMKQCSRVGYQGGQEDFISCRINLCTVSVNHGLKAAAKFRKIYKLLQVLLKWTSSTKKAFMTRGDKVEVL